MEESSRRQDVPGHFTNENSRHTQMYSNRHAHPGTTRRLMLYDQQQPQRRVGMETFALQPGEMFGQACFQTVDTDAEGDGSFSLAHIELPEGNSQAVQATPSLDTASTTDMLPRGGQHSTLTTAVAIQPETGLAGGTTHLISDQWQYELLAERSINHSATQNQILLNRRNDSTLACGQQIACVVPDDHVEPVDIEAQQASLRANTNNEKRKKCYLSFKRAGHNDDTATAFANQYLYFLNVESKVKCLHCNQTSDMNATVIHSRQCPALEAIRTVQIDTRCNSARGVRYTGEYGANAKLICKKPERETTMSPCYPQQMSEARQPDVVFKPSQPNQNFATTFQTLPTGPGDGYVRAESACRSASSQSRTEARMMGNEGANAKLICKKPERETTISPCCPQQMSEARKPDVVFPPNQPNQNLAPAFQTSPTRPGDGYVRAESAYSSASGQRRTEARMLEKEGANAKVMCKKPERETMISPCCPQQMSEARQPDVVFPPNQPNQTLASAFQTSPTRPGDGYVRAESACSSASSQRRTEARMLENGGGASMAPRKTLNSSSHGSSLSLTTSIYRTAGSSSEDLNLECTAQQRVHHPEFADTQKRFASFYNIPETVTQQPQSLAKAGLFYTGYKDTCRCFWCGGDLHGWKPEDNPWQEHARHYPNCGFVKQKKGQESIDSIQFAVSPAENETKVKDTDSSNLHRKGKASINSRKSGKTCASVEILPQIPQREQISTTQGPRENSSQGNHSSRYDYTKCGFCKQRRAIVCQHECGHIVCTGCAPPRDDQTQVHFCKICRERVVECKPLVLL